jgi:hypothetical protein
MDGGGGAAPLHGESGDGRNGDWGLALVPVVDAEALRGRWRAGGDPLAHAGASTVGGQQERSTGGRSAFANKGRGRLGKHRKAEADGGVEVQPAPAPQSDRLVQSKDVIW